MSDTEQLIDILTVIDAESVMEQFSNSLSTDPSKPTPIGENSNLVYMFVKWNEVISGDGSSNLNVSVGPNNIIRWRGTSLTMNTAYSIMLLSCDIGQGKNLISPPIPIAPQVYVPVPVLSGNTVTGTTTQSLEDFYFQSTALGTGKVTYAFSFAITNNDGKVLGYFKWDPSLVVS